MLIHFTDIMWDTDGEAVDLPADVVLEVDDNLDVATEGADVLSDKFSWCVESFNFEGES